MTAEPQPHFCHEISCQYNTHIHSPTPGDRKWVCGSGKDPETCAMMTAEQPDQHKHEKRMKQTFHTRDVVIVFESYIPAASPLFKNKLVVSKQVTL